MYYSYEYLICSKENRLVGVYRRPQYGLRSHTGRLHATGKILAFKCDITNFDCTEGKLVHLREYLTERDVYGGSF